MPHTVERTAYTFAELSERAKERARDRWREGGQHDGWWDGVYEDAERAAACLGISFARRGHGDLQRKEPAIYFSGFWSQGDGASWEGSYKPKLDTIKAVTEYAPEDEELLRIAQELTVLQSTYRLQNGHYVEAKVSHRGSYYHSHSMDVTVYCDDRGEEVENKNLVQLLRDFADWIYKQLEAEDEYLNSNECIDGALAEREFDEDGIMI